MKKKRASRLEVILELIEEQNFTDAGTTGS
jgi:hypothetical protein